MSGCALGTTAQQRAGRGTRQGDPSAFHHKAALRHFKRSFAFCDQQDAHAQRGDSRMVSKIFLHHQRDPTAGFVQHEARSADARAIATICCSPPEVPG